MSLYETGNWSHEQQRMRREREELERAAQNLVGPIRAVQQKDDRYLLDIINRANIAPLTTTAKQSP